METRGISREEGLVGDTDIRYQTRTRTRTDRPRRLDETTYSASLISCAGVCGYRAHMYYMLAHVSELLN